MEATKEEKDKIKQEKKALREIKKMDCWGITEKDYFRKEKELTKSFGREPLPGDVVWGIYGELVFKYAKNYSKLESIWYSRALFITEEGKDPNFCLKEVSKTRLNDWKEQGVNKVQIFTMGAGSIGACDFCIENEGKILTVKEAFTTMPIPNSNCNFKFKENHFSFCRCMYQPISD